MHAVLVTVPSFGDYSQAKRSLEEAGCVLTFAPAPPLSEAALLQTLPACDAVIAGGDHYTARVIEACPRLRIISRFGVGTDKVDLAAAGSRGIPVGITPNQEGVADLTFALLLALARRITEADAFVRSGKWGVFTGFDVYRRTLGVIGTGRIGRAVVRRARGFEMRVLAFDAYPDDAASRELGCTYVPLDELLGESDFVSLHCALDGTTRGLIGARELALMKPTACLVNTARPGIVQEAPLVEALAAKRIAGYAADVHEPAPPPPDHPLLAFANVIATPWMASYTPDTLAEMETIAAGNVLRALRGEPLLHQAPAAVKR